MNWIKIKVPAYWQQRGTGYRVSSIARVYNDWLVDNHGSAGEVWKPHSTHVDSWEESIAQDYLEFLIADTHDPIKIQTDLTFVGMMHILRHGLNWQPTGEPK